MAKKRKKKRTSAKKRRGKRTKKTLNLASWKSINFHPKTGSDLKGLGYAMNVKTGEVKKWFS